VRRLRDNVLDMPARASDALTAPPQWVVPLSDLVVDHEIRAAYATPWIPAFAAAANTIRHAQMRQDQIDAVSEAVLATLAGGEDGSGARVGDHTHGESTPTQAGMRPPIDL
jgi:hypothetical protein